MHFPARAVFAAGERNGEAEMSKGSRTYAPLVSFRVRAGREVDGRANLVH
jgi:hypothetical protein